MFDQQRDIYGTKLLLKFLIKTLKLGTEVPSAIAFTYDKFVFQPTLIHLLIERDTAPDYRNYWIPEQGCPMANYLSCKTEQCAQVSQ